MDSYYKQIDHKYPEQFRILDNPFLTSLCAQASQDTCSQPLFNHLIRSIYKELFINILNQEWPQVDIEVKTRMSALHKDLRLKSRILNPQTKAVCVDIARAGMLPSQVFFDELNAFVDPAGVRHDHIFASRQVGDDNQVTHTELSSSKVGGDIDQAFVFIPDPMGATGNSLSEVIQHYKDNVEGTPVKFISAHMIITPEFIKTMNERHPDVIVYSARLDRGFSTPEALAETPGHLWEQEKGLNDSQYIVPGAGGVGELINNSFV